ncbi:MAG: YraN family protein, partial [Nitrospinaceae bacterium]|nr:YraN family protein [Nitrospinaceae bacterium]
MTEKRLKLGREGENAAEAYLKKKGYRIIEKNFRCELGEIDIIAEQDGVV